MNNEGWIMAQVLVNLLQRAGLLSREESWSLWCSMIAEQIRQVQGDR